MIISFSESCILMLVDLENRIAIPILILQITEEVIEVLRIAVTKETIDEMTETLRSFYPDS